MVTFGSFTYSQRDGLTDRGKPIRLGRSERMLLEIFLTEEVGKIVPRDYLIQKVWAQYDLVETLDNSIKNLRKALGDDAERQGAIRTYKRVGYAWLLEYSRTPIPPAGTSVVSDGFASSPRQFRALTLAAVALALLAGFWWLYGRWGNPFVKTPESEPTRFAVAVASLGGDRNHASKDLIVQSLLEDPAIRVIALRESIPITGAVPEDDVRRGHNAARALLKKYNAQCIIWGVTIRSGPQEVLKLFWTVETDASGPKWPTAPKWGRYQPTPELALPATFWVDLRETLRLLVMSQRPGALPDAGRSLEERREFASRVRNLLRDREDWPAAVYRDLQVTLIEVLRGVGFQTGDDVVLQEAIGLGLEVLKQGQPSSTQHSVVRIELASALFAIGDHKGDTAQLDGAISHAAEAIKALDEKLNPYLWARAQNVRGTVLVSLAQRRRQLQLLREALNSYENAQRVWTKADAPLTWARLHTNRANALSVLGGAQRSVPTLQQAIATYDEGLAALPREQLPIDWARAKTNLAITLGQTAQQLLSSAEDQRALLFLRRAVTESRAALETLQGAEERVMWIRAKSSEANSLSILGQHETGTATLRDAISAHDAVLKVVDQREQPIDWLLTTTNLAETLRFVYDRTGSLDVLERGIRLYTNSVDKWPQDHPGWLAGQAGLAIALLRRARHTQDAATADDAVRRLRSVVQKATEVPDPIENAKVRFYLGDGLRQLAVERGNVSDLCEALVNHSVACQSLSGRSREIDCNAAAKDDQLALTKVATRQKTWDPLTSCIKRSDLVRAWVGNK